jgi:tetratricopeptide (TPR) repeat protein
MGPWFLIAAAAAPQAEALQIRRSELGDGDPDTLASLYASAWLFHRKGDYRTSEGYITEALAGRRRRGDVRETLGCMLLLGDVLAREGRLEEAERYKRQNLEGCVRAFPNDAPQTLFARLQLGMTIMWRGRIAEAQPYLEDALGGMRRTLPKDHPDTLNALVVLGTQRMWAGDLPRAESLFRECVAGNRANDGDESRESILARRRLAEVLRRRGNLDEAEVNIKTAVDAARASLEPDNVDRLWVDEELAALREAQGRMDEAETGFADLYRRVPRLGLDPPSVARLMSGYGTCLAHRRRYAEAEAPLLEANRRLSECGYQWDGRMFKVVEALAAVCEHTGPPDAAAHWEAELSRLRAATQPSASTSRAAG